MFELTTYFDKAKQLNEKLITSYDLEITLTDSHTITLKNENCKVEFSTGRYYLDFHFFLTTSSPERKYSVIELFEMENIVVKEVLNEKEQSIAKELTDEIERYLYIYSVILQRKLIKYITSSV